MENISYDTARLQKNFDQLLALFAHMQGAVEDIKQVGSTLNNINFGQGQDGIHTQFLRAGKDGEELQQLVRAFANKLQSASHGMQAKDTQIGQAF